MPRELLGDFKVNADGSIVQNPTSTGKRFSDWLENVATITGKPMQWVENHVNRGATFKIAFLERYKQLENDANVVLLAKKELSKKGREFTDDAEFQASTEARQEIDAIRQKQASNYAGNIVKELHYLYDAWAKPKAVRGPIGGALGQFTTYSINFFEYQRKILSKGGNDLMKAQWDSPHITRMFRLGMLYNIVYGLSALFNTSFGNLIENDTADRIMRLNTLLTGTEEEKEKEDLKRYKGGPIIDDVRTVIKVLNAGQLSSFLNFNEEEASSYLDSYIDFHNRSGEMDATEEIVRTLNTGIGRLIYTHGPRMVNGSGMRNVMFDELALYDSPETAWLRKAMFGIPQKYAPKPVADYFTPDKSSKFHPDRETKLSQTDIAKALNALRRINPSR